MGRRVAAADRPSARRASLAEGDVLKRHRSAARPARPDTARLAVRDHDLPEMTAALEMPVGRLGLGEGERPVDHGAQVMQLDGPVHRLKIGAASDADRTDSYAAAGQQ